MKYAVIGAGNIGQALSCYLASKDAEFVLCTRDPEKASAINNNGLRCRGIVEGTFKVKAVTDPVRAITNAKYIFVTTNAPGRRDAAFQYRALAEEKQTVLVFGGYWGAWEFRTILGGAVNRLKLTIAETASQIFTSKISPSGQVFIGSAGPCEVSAANMDETEGLIDSLENLFPQFTRASSILYTSMCSIDPLVRASLIMKNVEVYGRFLLGYLVKERAHIASALGEMIGFGLRAPDGEPGSINLDEIWENAESTFSKNRKPLTNRFVTEDIPFFLAPIARIGDLIGVETPTTDRLIAACEAKFGDFVTERRPMFREEDLESFCDAGI